MHGRLQPLHVSGPNMIRTVQIRRNILWTLLTVSVILGMTSLPKQVVILMYTVGQMNVDFNGLSYNFSILLVYFNTCVNPLIYLFQFDEFPRGLRNLYCRRKRVGISTVSGMMMAPQHNCSNTTRNSV